MANLITIQFSPRAPEAVQVEVPALIPVAKDAPKGAKPSERERSCKGSLHLRPGETKTITQDELDFLQGTDKAPGPFAKFVRVLHVVEDKPVVAEKAPEAPADKKPAKSDKPE